MTGPAVAGGPPAADTGAEAGLRGKSVLVTGAAGGFGAATAAAFARSGARVVLADVDLDRARETAAGLGGACAVRCDVLDAADITSAIGVAVDRNGGLDVLVNNAGLPHRRAPLETLSVHDVEFQLAMNVRSVVLACQLALPELRRRPGASIVNVSSIGAVRPRPGMVMYSATKGAVLTLTRGLAAEVAPDVRVNVVCPVASETGFVKNALGTDRLTEEMRHAIVSEIPMGRPATPDDVARAILYLASDRAAFLTGVVLDVDGGRSI
jgi:3-oxoacyl-[acyl-carrier protein] reductase